MTMKHVTCWGSLTALAAIALATGCASSSDSLREVGAPADPVGRGAGVHSVLDSGLTPEQRARPGKDARDVCEGKGRDFVQAMLKEPKPQLLRGFLAAGSLQVGRWSGEAGGFEFVKSEDPAVTYSETPQALCWYKGTFMVSVPAEEGNEDIPASHIVLVVPTDGDALNPTVLISRDSPIPIWAPPSN